MPVAKPRRRRKPPGRYHHGDLRRALVEEAVRTIQAEGVEQLTLRAVGVRLGVSRTALYRHFPDKQALLAAVGREGFRMLGEVTSTAWQTHGPGPAGLDAMGAAYVSFATSHPSHYRVMFGSFLESSSKDEAFVQVANAAFDILLNAVKELQQQGLVRRDDPLLLSLFIWSMVHGIAMLGIDGHLGRGGADDDVLHRYAAQRMRDALRAG